ncbi:MAG: DUF3139 domain-containing protein [Bacillaceae bacterium]|nr:DUF3139 domain-containing protein [Bacillaceae bacterium]
MRKFNKGWKISAAILILLVLVPFLYIQINKIVYEKRVTDYLIEEKGYRGEDIQSVTGKWGFKLPPFYTEVVFRDEPDVAYIYFAHNDVKQFDYHIPDEEKQGISESALKHLESVSRTSAILPVKALSKIDASLLQDRDALIARGKTMDDYIGIEVTQEELVSLAENKAYQDYKQVLLTFVEERLGLAVDTFQTIQQSENQRWLLVTTRTQNVLKISMTRWPEHNHIWTVEAVGAF